MPTRCLGKPSHPCRPHSSSPSFTRQPAAAPKCGRAGKGLADDTNWDSVRLDRSEGDEVKAMRRFLKTPALFTVGLVLFVAGCAGDSPTSPTSTPPPGTGTCNVTITLAATTVTPLAGTAITLRATVQRNGVTVPDGTSITFVTDFGFF